jgi:hypothetical protein
MATRIPAHFLRTGEGAVASYDFFDLVTNTAYKVFYAARNTTNQLITHTTESNSIRTSRNSSGTTEVNFDYTFNLPLRMGGDFTLVQTIDVTSAIAATPTEAYLSIRFLHVNAANTETQIVAATVSDTLSSTSPVCETVVISGTFPETFFKSGEKLRLEASFVMTKGSGSPVVYYYHDPANRGTPANEASTGESPTTELKMVLPFKVDI